MIEGMQAVLLYWMDGGWLLVPIALVSFGIWVYWLRLRSGLGQAVNAAQTLEQELDAWIKGRAPSTRIQAWMNRLAARDGATARRRFDHMASVDVAAVQRDVFVLKALTAAAPLLGLLGTVTGMVATFGAVSRQGGEGATGLAAGIHAALITTQLGLVAALPGVFGLLHLGRLRAQWQSALGAIGMRWYTGWDTVTAGREGDGHA